MPIVFTVSAIRSAPALSIAWRGRAATRPASSRSNTASAGNGWSCSRRSRRRDAGGGPSGSRLAASGDSQFAAIQAVAPSLRVEVNPLDVRDAGEIERAVAAFARAPNGGLIVTAAAGYGFIAT